MIAGQVFSHAGRINTQVRNQRKSDAQLRNNKIGNQGLHVVTAVKRKLKINIMNWYPCVTRSLHVKWVIPEKIQTTPTDGKISFPVFEPGLPRCQGDFSKKKQMIFRCL